MVITFCLLFFLLALVFTALGKNIAYLKGFVSINIFTLFYSFANEKSNASDLFLGRLELLSWLCKSKLVTFID